MAVPNSGAIVDRLRRSVKAVSVARTLVIGAPGPPLAQPFRIGATLSRSLAECGEQLIAHLGGHLVADRATPVTRLGIEKALDLFGTLAGGADCVEQTA